jgi:phosphoribosyl 1,2-cyclic phosphate phosphodiesterase
MKTAISADIRGQMIILGTGTSVGVPALGCGCDVCRSPDPKNKRSRCSIILGLPTGNLLVDTPPDLRQQLLREDLGIVDAVLFTHEHADHLFGLDDLRLFPFYLGKPVPLYCETSVENRIRKSYDYAFADDLPTHPGATPRLVFENISTDPFVVLGYRVVPIRLDHGPRFQVLGFRFGNIAYCTDTNHVPPSSMELLRDLDVLIIDALRLQPHATHFSLDQAVQLAQSVGAKQTYLTHTSHELEYHATNAALPPGIEMAYDGLRIPLSDHSRWPSIDPAPPRSL